MMDPVEIVTKQIEAYNRKNIDAIMVLCSEDFKIIRFSDGYVLVDGKEACGKMHEQLFNNSPHLFAGVIKRIDFNNKIVLYEFIHGRKGDAEKTEQLNIFEIVHDKIAKLYRL